MVVSVLVAALVAAQPATSLPGPDIELTEQKQVAYEMLANGDAAGALTDLESRVVQEPQDPALLINLGTTYARLGRTERAAAAYQAAIDSETQYRLELADGRWLDSRRAARMALTSLGSPTTLASR